MPGPGMGGPGRGPGRPDMRGMGGPGRGPGRLGMGGMGGPGMGRGPMRGDPMWGAPPPRRRMGCFGCGPGCLFCLVLMVLPVVSLGAVVLKRKK